MLFYCREQWMKSFLKVLAITTLIFNCGIRACQQELWNALQEGSFWKVKKAVEHGASVTEALEDGATPLLQALETENSKIVLYLLSHGAESTINTPNKAGLYPLMLAIGLDTTTMRIMLQYGANKSINAISHGETALSIAIRLNKEDVVFLLLEYGAKQSINVPNEDNEYPLLRAVKINNVNLVRIVLAHGGDASINSVSDEYETPLYCACCSDLHRIKEAFCKGKKPNIDIVQILLEHGAAQSLDISNGGLDPMLAAVHSGNIKIVQMLFAYGAAKYIIKNAHDKSNILTCAIDCDDFALVRLVCELGAFGLINKKDSSGITPLFYATSIKNLDIAQYLLEHGASPSLAITCTDTLLNRKFTGTPLECAQYLRQLCLKYQINDNIEPLITLLREWTDKKTTISEIAHN
jgi:ankyrin repeat protein